MENILYKTGEYLYVLKFITTCLQKPLSWLYSPNVSQSDYSTGSDRRTAH